MTSFVSDNVQGFLNRRRSRKLRVRARLWSPLRSLIGFQWRDQQQLSPWSGWPKMA